MRTFWYQVHVAPSRSVPNPNAMGGSVDSGSTLVVQRSTATFAKFHSSLNAMPPAALVQVAPAVAKDHLACDQLSIVAREKRNQASQMLGLHALFDCLISHHPIEGFFLGVLRSPRSGYHARHHCVHRNTFFAHFPLEIPGHPQHCALACDVRHLAG